MGISSIIALIGVLVPSLAPLSVEGAQISGNATTTYGYALHQGSTEAVLHRSEAIQDEKGRFQFTTVLNKVTVTAYSSTPDQTDDSPFIMASGKHVYDGAVAANFLPFGTAVRFPDLYGDKVFYVEDRMNRRYKDRMDIWMTTRGEARSFGLKHTRVEVLALADNL